MSALTLPVLTIDCCSCRTNPSLTQTFLQNTTLTPPLNIQPWASFRPKNYRYSDLIDMLLFLAFLFSLFISNIFLFVFCCCWVLLLLFSFAMLSEVNIMNNSSQYN